MPDASALYDALVVYSSGKVGTRFTIEAIGGRDYADLLIALSGTDLDFPKPTETSERSANIERARALLAPRLRRAD